MSIYMFRDVCCLIQLFIYGSASCRNKSQRDREVRVDAGVSIPTFNFKNVQLAAGVINMLRADISLNRSDLFNSSHRDRPIVSSSFSHTAQKMEQYTCTNI